MTSRPPPSLPQDAFVDHSSSKHASGGLPLLTSTDPSLLSPPVEDISRQNVHSDQSHNLPCASFHHGQTDDSHGDTMSSHSPVRPDHLQFRSNTIAPPPPLPLSEPISECPPTRPLDETDLAGSALEGPSQKPSVKSSLSVSTSLRSSPTRNDNHNHSYGSANLAPSGGLPLQRKTSSSSLKPVSRTPSLKRALANSIGSACSSAVPSPLITAMGDITPLPSPLLMGDSPGPWKRFGGRPPSREAPLPTIMPDSALVTASGESVASALASHSKRKTYVGLNAGDASAGLGKNGENKHGRNRSVSEYVPDPMAIPKRQTTVSGSHARSEVGHHGTDDKLRREPNLGAARGLVPSHQPPTPPPSESSQSTDGSITQSRKPKEEYFEAYGRYDKKLRRWRAVKQLGEGTFSRVMLATSQVSTDEPDTPNAPAHAEPDLKTLVAVKVCEHGPRGGASEDRIEMSLKRELEIMQTLRHPSLVHLKAWNIEQTRALLVISYCPGGDLFDLAARHKELLTPPLLRRIFAELVGAVRYLHERRIVHRDIKLESRCLLTDWRRESSPLRFHLQPPALHEYSNLSLGY